MLWETINLFIAAVNTTSLALSAPAAIHMQYVNTYTNTPLGITTFTDSRGSSGGWKQDDSTTQSWPGHMIAMKTFWLQLHVAVCAVALHLEQSVITVMTSFSFEFLLKLGFPLWLVLCFSVHDNHLLLSLLEMGKVKEARTPLVLANRFSKKKKQKAAWQQGSKLTWTEKGLNHQSISLWQRVTNTIYF